MAERPFCSLGVLASLLLASAVFLSAQDLRPAEQAYKNIKVMQGIPANQVQEGMHVIKASLGVDCTFCHVEGKFDLDDVPMKTVARGMFQMMTGINQANFGGRAVVTCYTCHKGHEIPEDIVGLPAPPVVDATKSTAVLPTVDQVLSKYIDALGGEAAMRKVMTRRMTGTQDIPTGPGGTVPVPATLDRALMAPNLMVDVYKTATITISSGFDGTAAWNKGQNGNVTSPTPEGVDAERARRAAAFYEPLTLRQQYPSMSVDGIVHVGNRDAYLVTGTPAADTPERLYFDTQTGLLLRKWTYIVSATGRSPYQLDFEDYRDTGSGVKIPFVVHMSPAGPRTELEPTSTLRITSVKDNVPIDAATFVKPQPAPRPAARQP